MDINQEINLLRSLETVSGAAAGFDLSLGKLSGAEKEINEISAFLDVTPLQAVFFSCLAGMSFQKTVTIDALAKHMGCSSLRLVTSLQEIETLEKRGLVSKTVRARGRKPSYNDFGYNVPYNVIEALRKNDRKELEETTRFDLPGFLKEVSDLVDERQNRNMVTAQLLQEVDFLISRNLDIPFVSFVDSSLRESISKCTIFCAAFVRLKGVFCMSLDRFAGALFHDLSEQLEFCQMVVSGNHELIRNKMMKPGESDFEGEKTLTLEHKASKILYQDYPALLMPEPATRGVVSHSSIRAKRLFYPEALLPEVKALERVMNSGRFRSYTKALAKNGLTKGVTAIFFGDPGTGKTETVYQLARLTKRNICMVDLSQTRSKWFGESEKRVRQIFVDYSEMLKNSETEPILFINEADGLFSSRMAVSSKSMSADQTMNTMQNILLQSLEEFEGILIATTNLASNLDKAFERRFTFKLNFPRPGPETRKRIWKSKVPRLTDEEAVHLAERFEITGGEIDLHVRQVILRKVLDRRVSIAKELGVSCSRMHGFEKTRKIGFRAGKMKT